MTDTSNTSAGQCRCQYRPGAVCTNTADGPDGLCAPCRIDGGSGHPNRHEAEASAAGPLFVSFKSSGGFGNAVLNPMAEPKSMDDIEAIQERLRREFFGWTWRWRKLLLLTWKVLDA